MDCSHSGLYPGRQYAGFPQGQEGTFDHIQNGNSKGRRNTMTMPMMSCNGSPTFT